MAWEMYGVRPVSHARCGMMACMDVARLQPVTCAYPPVIPPSSGAVWGRNPLFAFHSTGFQRVRGQTTSETTQTVHDPQPAQYQLSFISSFRLFWCVLCCPAPGPTSTPDRDVHISTLSTEGEGQARTHNGRASPMITMMMILT